ncbi:hypothetical protein [Pseudonocardia spirodelae]|uniref:Uncharacterized protein n=1 Tax=Pseudonocardia spirodelae TaxID=3133431 RepID=A0ABU8TCA4_9PSEU
MMIQLTIYDQNAENAIGERLPRTAQSGRHRAEPVSVERRDPLPRPDTPGPARPTHRRVTAGIVDHGGPDG